MPAVRHRARRPAVEEPGAQLPLLRPGELGDPLRLIGVELDQGEGLQDGVVHPRGHVGPLLGADPGLALDHEVTRDPQPPRPEHHDDRGDHEHEPAESAEARRASVCPDSTPRQPDRSAARRRSPVATACGTGVRSGPYRGSTHRSGRSSACSSALAFRAISTSPAALTTNGKAREPSQPTPSAEAMNIRTRSTRGEARPQARCPAGRGPRRWRSPGSRPVAGSISQRQDVGGRAEAADQRAPARTRSARS